MQKKSIAILILCVMTVSLFGCGKTSEKDTSFGLFSKAKDEIQNSDATGLGDTIVRPGEVDFTDDRGTRTLYDGVKLTNFGHFDMDGNVDNGEEALEWLVLDETDEQFLLLSRYVFKPVPFKKNYEDVKTWENSRTREYLNNEFLDTMFSESEKSQIVLTELENAPNPNGNGGCQNTKDYVFSLSLEEILNYYEPVKRDYYTEDNYFSNPLLMCDTAPYAITDYGSQKISYRMWEDTFLFDDFTIDLCGKTISSWALRTSDSTGEGCLNVNFNGDIYYQNTNNYVDYATCLRPAMWVKKTADLELRDYIPTPGKGVDRISDVRPMSFIMFDDQEMILTLSESVVDYCMACHEEIRLLDDNDEEMFSIIPDRTSARFWGVYFDRSQNTEISTEAYSDNLKTRHDRGVYTYQFGQQAEHRDTANQMPTDALMEKIAKFDCGNGRKVSFDRAWVTRYTHEEYKLALMDPELQDIVFRYDEDAKRMMPTTDDYRVEYWEVPAVNKLSGYGTGFTSDGYAAFYGLSNDMTNMPCKFVRVTSYGADGTVENVRERISFQTQEDAYYTEAAGDVLLLFKDYNGKNEIPSSFSAEELITHVNKKLLPQRVKDYANLNIENVDCCFYSENTEGNLNDSIARAFHLSLGKINNPMELKNKSLMTKETFYSDNGTLDGTCTAKCGYSKPANHCPKLILGKGDAYLNNYRQAVYDMGFSSYKEDKNYLVPATNDYILFFVGSETGDPCQEVSLISFDEKGHVIQNIQRQYKADNCMNTMEELYSGWVDEGAKVLYVDDYYFYLDLLPAENVSRLNKVYRLSRLMDFEFDNASLCSPEMACSISHCALVNQPNLTEESAKFECDMYPFDENILKNFTKLSDDYRVTYTKAFSLPDYNYKNYYDINYYTVTFYDTLGNPLGEHSRDVLEFKTEAEAKAFEQDVLNYRPLWNPERDGRYLAVNTNVDHRTKFWYLVRESLDPNYEYFSMPYLTQVQINIFENDNWCIR